MSSSNGTQKVHVHSPLSGLCNRNSCFRFRSRPFGHLNDFFRVCPNCKAADNQNSLLFQLRRLENQLFYDVGYGLRDRTGLSMIPTRSIAPKDKFVFRPSSNRQNSLKARVHQSFLYSTKMIIICVEGLKLFQNLVN